MRTAIITAAILLASVPCIAQDSFAPDASRRVTTFPAVGTVAEYTFLVRDGQYYLVDFVGLKFTPVRVTFLVPPGPQPPVPPEPTPVPPTPPEPPKPEPTPVPSGPRQLLIIRETADATPQIAQLIVALRSGSNATYLRDKGHTLSILDDDAVTPSGQPSLAVQAWRSVYEPVGLPCLIVASKTATGTKVLYAGKIATTATAANILDTVKANGG